MLKGKTAIVTGSTSGIGLGIAKVLAGSGANIMLNGFADAATVEAVTREVEALGAKVSYNGADVTKSVEVDALIEQAKETFGSVDIVVNNAGIQFVAPIEEFPLEKWDAVIATNMSSAFYTMRRAIPLMREKGWGRIINIASAHGLVASARKIAYVAAKHAIIGMTKVAALETAGQGITCNAICPGWVLTPLVQKQIEAIAATDGTDIETAKKKLLLEKQPSGAFASPEEIGGLVAFLCSTSAQQITGSSYSIDGGWTAQ